MKGKNASGGPRVAIKLEHWSEKENVHSGCDNTNVYVRCKGRKKANEEGVGVSGERDPKRCNALLDCRSVSNLHYRSDAAG